MCSFRSPRVRRYRAPPWAPPEDRCRTVRRVCHTTYGQIRQEPLESPSDLVLAMRRVYRRWFRRTDRGRDMRVEDHAPESLQRCQGELPGRAACEVPLNVILAEGEHRRHRQVPDTRDHQQLDDVVVEVGDLLLDEEELTDGGDVGER